MTILDYIHKINRRYLTGIAKEHAYRPDLEALLHYIAPDVDVTNEPANVTDCGNPDYVLMRGNIPAGYIEAKDIGKDLDAKQYKEQFDRYRKALDNLIITDYLRFRFYRQGQLVHEVRIAEVRNDEVVPLPDHFTQFTNLILDFCSFQGQTIKSPQKLAEMMAAKARLLQNILEKAATDDENAPDNTELKAQLIAFRQILIHDIGPREFADLYAQTMAYGMFAARLHDPTLETFTRQEAAELIPKTNPFLRKLFGHIAGPDIDERIRPVVDNLADVFRATDVAALLADFGKNNGQHDPIIHFYETFLAEYDPRLRKSRGVWYTPKPVVNFMVRAVDDLLKTEFGLQQGLADTSKTKIKINTQNPDKRSTTGYRQEEREVHRVQILDPATGTATFLAEIIEYLHHSRFQGMPGIWSSYVDEHLIPRLHGFELLMASYAMAHLKLDLLLKETGYTPTREQRFKVYLTNSLEEYHPDTGTLFSSWLSAEANEANHIKRDTPVMVIIGNPPYSGESANKGEWIMKLMEDYKKEPGGKEKLKEKNPKWINDDYMKFLRYGQYFIERNGEGILAFINPHGFLDNPTFRGMRWNLLKTYDKIYTIDLHGNSKKKETAPDGSPDVNVFDIMQGVSINLFIKTGKKKDGELGKVFHFDLYGKREMKYDFLLKNSISETLYKALDNIAPNFFFVQKDFEIQSKYDKGFKTNELLSLNVLGFQTHRDYFAIGFNKATIYERIKGMIETSISDEDFLKKYGLRNADGWTIQDARTNLRKSAEWENDIIECSYRPFDQRYCYFNDVVMDRPRKELKKHVQSKDNLTLNIVRQTKMDFWAHAIVSKNPTPALFVEIKDGSNAFPLYLYPGNSAQTTIDQTTRTPNLNPAIVQQIADKIRLRFTNEKEADAGTFAPIDLLDYIYAVLHSPTYRETYKEFLKIDFPRVPYPKDAGGFWRLVSLGAELRALHLMESPALDRFLTTYPASGDNVVGKIRYESGKVWINDTQYFEGVPEIAWQFYIGGYQPAQKWLKDRKGRELKYEDILHYQRIIVALAETDRIMKEIDELPVL